MRRLAICIGVIVLLAAAAVTGHYMRGGPDSEARQAIAMYHRFCRSTLWGVRQDRVDFESGDPKRQQAALDRFFDSLIIHHGVRSIVMCLERESDIARVSYSCILAKDFTCHANAAQRAEELLERWRTP